jgi:hypothetical protein
MTVWQHLARDRGQENALAGVQVGEPEQRSQAMAAGIVASVGVDQPVGGGAGSVQCWCVAHCVLVRAINSGAVSSGSLIEQATSI